MELFSHLALGFGEAVSPMNVLYCFIGVFFGTAIGVLPGLGPIATISMLLPITYTLEPSAALIMLAGIYYGAQYGGSTTAILVRLPGEASSIVTCIDGYEMARNGRAGAALAIAALGSFFAGCVATLVIAGLAPVLTRFALDFGPSEYFSLMVTGMIGALILARGSLIRAFAMLMLGLIIGLIGIDVNSGTLRFTFGVLQLYEGIEVAVVAMGLFAFSEIIINLHRRAETGEPMMARIGRLWPSAREFRQAWPASVRGTAIGSVLGVLPGGGALLSSFASYAVEKRISPSPGSRARNRPTMPARRRPSSPC